MIERDGRVEENNYFGYNKEKVKFFIQGELPVTSLDGKLLIDKNLKKTDLSKLTGISESTLAKLNKGENVNTEILDRICKTLKCDISDIVEFEKKEAEEK